MGKVSGQAPENTSETGSILFLHSGKPPRRSFQHCGKPFPCFQGYIHVSRLDACIPT